MKEHGVTQRITNILNSYGGSVLKYRPVPGMYGNRAVDYLCCAAGIYFVIEAKRPGKEPTPLQQVFMNDVQHAGGTTIVITGEEWQYDSLKQFINQCIKFRKIYNDQWPNYWLP